MNGFILLLPVMLVRYALLYALNKSAFQKAAFFPPVIGGEKTAFFIYQTSTVMIFIYMFFLKADSNSHWFFIGLITYCLGVLLCALSTIHYARPSENGINQNGLYRFSRNPMYIAYFVAFLGCAMLTASYVLLALIIAFQISAHWIILSEERWCKEKFGDAYIQYMKKVRRYI